MRVIRTVTGKAKLGLKMAMPEETGHPVTSWTTPEKLDPKQIKNRLCSAGPKKCAECRLCAFGRYYVDNNLQRLEPKKQKKSRVAWTKKGA